jgi:hypothetical protein
MRRQMSLEGSARIPRRYAWAAQEGGIAMRMHRWMILLLLFGGRLGNAVTDAASSPPSPMGAIVAIQVQLWALGDDPGPIDGRGGWRTIVA